MPYMLSPDGLAVHKQNADQSMGEMVGQKHATKAEALAHMKALYANEPDASKESAAPDTSGTLIERDIPAETRDDAADSDFVDKDNRSFPILKAEDVMAAVHAFGRYKGPMSFEQFKTRLTSIAKRKGFEGSLPKDWTDEKAKESVSMGVIPPADLGYMAQSPIADAMCAKCCYFIAGQTSYCQKVRGAVEPLGWCRSFEPEHGDEDSESSSMEMPMMPDEPEANEAAGLAGLQPMVQSVTPTEIKRVTTRMTEAVDWAKAKVDTDRRTLKDVVLIQSGMSKNRKLYTASALEKAVPVFEGAKAFADHPTKEDQKSRPERSIRDVAGWYSNVRYQDGKLVADRHFTRNQAGNDAWGIAQDVASGNAPASLAGLSINAAGIGNVKKDGDGDYVEVEDITYAFSVDDVTSPAAGGAYKLTASGLDPLVAAELGLLTYEEWFESRPEYRLRLQNEMKKARQDEAVKAEMALKEAAVSEAGRLSEVLKKANERIAAVEAERDAALNAVQGKARELAIELALQKVSLKESWKESLRKQMAVKPESEWAALIEAEVVKAKDGHALPRIEIPVTGKPVLAESKPTLPTFKEVTPKPEEDFNAWMERLNNGSRRS